MAIDATKALPALRIGVGVLSLAAPGLAARSFGMDLRSNPQAGYMARLFGVRDIALAVGLLAAPAGQRKLWLQIGAACDAVDVLSAAAETRAGRVPTMTGVLGGAAAVAATAMGLQALGAEA